MLLTSVGKRNYLIEYFKLVVHPLGGMVHAINSHEYSSALYCADKFHIAPIINSEQYIPFLLQYCRNNNIRLIVPLFDNDLPVLAKDIQLFNEIGVFVLVPDWKFAQLANDKYKTFEFLTQFAFKTVSNYLNIEDFRREVGQNSASYPYIIKPRWGMASQSVYEVNNEEELVFFYNRAQKEIKSSFLNFESQQDPGNEVLIMEKIPGDEYMLDVINDLHGNYLTTIINKKILRKGGETEVAETVEHAALEELGKKIAALSKHPLVMDVDVIVNDNGLFILEFNPRFSGGYPFSHRAGINLPQFLVYSLLGKEVDIKTCLKPQIGTISMKGYEMQTFNKNRS